jgi:predicted ATPase/DNA-binding CsgD family transcriptional regulator
LTRLVDLLATGVFHPVMAAPVLRDSVGNLPGELTTFVGRRREVGEARRLLSTARLLTLTGMGGVGKTRLARRIATDVHRAFPDGVWQVELADLHEPALLVHTIATSLGLQEAGERWAGATLQEYLMRRRLLLLLDNCEHLIEACATTADALLRVCPGLQILATSREPLGINGEHTYPVRPLATPDLEETKLRDSVAGCDSVSLFVNRAEAVLPGFAVDDSNRRAVAQLCHRLDGVPLALELAALRLRALSPDQVLEHFDDRYLLTRGSRAAPPRQQTLSALVDWSYQLCSVEERLLWCLVSVFAGDFELEAAEGICEDTQLAGENVVDLIVGLVEKSVLVREEYSGVIRFRMPQMIRGFGRERLRQSMDETSVRRRHRDWYEALAARAYLEWAGPAQLSWFTRLRREHANIRAALEFSFTEPDGAGHAISILVPLIDYWIAFGFLSEGRHWLDQALRQCGEAGLTRARALLAATELAVLQGDQSAAAAMLNESRNLVPPTDHDADVAWLTFADARLAMLRGDLVTATPLYTEACDRFRACGDAHGVIAALVRLVLAEALVGDPDRALDRAEEFLSVADPRGELWGRSYALWALGIAKWRMGDNVRAVEFETESMILKQLFDDRVGMGVCVEVLAWIAAAQGRSQNAAELLGAAWHSLAAVGSSVSAFGFMVDDDERCKTDVRTKLGESAFRRTVQRGGELRFEEIIAIATGTKIPPDGHSEPWVDAAPSPLTRREREIAELIAGGMSNKEIAKALVIAQRTAEGHVEHILFKLGFTSRAQVAAWVAERRPSGDPA